MSPHGLINRRARRAGFTLLEVMVGVLVISMLTFSLYRFVQTSLLAVQTSTDHTVDNQAMVGLVNFVQGELNEIPAQGQGTLLGTAGKSHDQAQDQMQWICKPGQGLLTTAGNGDYFVTLTIQPVADRHSSDWEIGIRRRTINSDESDFNWLPLLRPAAAIEMRYYDPRVSAWLERWNDQSTRPTLVRLRVWRTNDREPYEAVLSVPAANLQPMPTAPTAPVAPGALQQPGVPGLPGVPGTGTPAGPGVISPRK